MAGSESAEGGHPTGVGHPAGVDAETDPYAHWGDTIVMSHSLTDAKPSPIAGSATSSVTVWPLSTQQLTRQSRELGRLHSQAYPPGHPDHRDLDPAAAADELQAIARGEILGPLLPQSRVAIAAGAIAGACLLVDRPGEAPGGGPWVIDIFRDPNSALTGIGRALLIAVLTAARTDRLPTISLAVSHSNTRARRLYDDLGFTVAEEGRTLSVQQT
jgi:GNAT superfamily N-acetyltransferase